MAEYIEYHPLKFWLDPASIAEIVAHIQSYLVANPINSTTEIETIIHDYLIAHPEIIGGVRSINGETGEVVLTADNISGGENVTIADVLDSLQDQIDDIVASIPSDYQQLIDDVSDLKSAFDDVLSKNLFNGNLSTGFMNLSGGINASATDYKYTDKIAVLGTTFIVTADNIVNGRRMNVPLRYLTAFDENENALSTYGQQNVSSNTYINTDGVNIITLDQSVKYIVLSIYKPTDKYTNISVSFDTSAIDYVPYGDEYKIKRTALPDEIKEYILRNYLGGKTVAVFGDSIMYGAGSDSKGAVDILAEKYDMTVAKYCVSGATMGVRTDDPSYTVDEAHHIAKQVRNAISASVKPDLIVFNGGTNDIGGQIPIGTMSEVYTQPATESYFADGFETVAYLLKKNFVGVPMIYMRAHNMSSRSYTGQIEYGELGNQIAEKWGIRNVDMYIRMNTQLAEYRTLYLADYTHPNNAGYNKYYVPALEDFIFRELV